MKKKQFKGKLDLNKMTICKLQQEQMIELNGGKGQTRLTFLCTTTLPTNGCVPTIGGNTCNNTCIPEPEPSLF